MLLIRCSNVLSCLKLDDSCDVSDLNKQTHTNRCVLNSRATTRLCLFYIVCVCFCCCHFPLSIQGTEKVNYMCTTLHEIKQNILTFLFRRVILHTCILTVYLFISQEDNLLPAEQKQEGAVSIKTYMAYFRSFHNLGAGFGIIFLFALCQVTKCIINKCYDTVHKMAAKI